MLRVATVGAGYFARFHHDGWARLDGARLAAICDRDEAKAREAAAAVGGGPAVYTDAAAMLEAGGIDLLDIAAPPDTHRDLIALAASHGLPAICQKAFCRTLPEAREATALAEAAGITLVVHENFRFQPWHRALGGMIAAGTLGPVMQASFRLRPGDGRGPRAYLDRQPYFQRMERFLIHETGIHFIDTFRYLLGEVEAVSARLARLNPAIRGEDAGIVVFDFAGGARALFDGNRLLDHPADDRRLTIGEMLVEGERASVRLDGWGRLFVRSFGESSEAEVPVRWERRGFAGDSVRALQAHVLAHLRGGAPVANRARDYLRNLEIEEAIYASSAAEGALVRVPAAGSG